MQTQGQKDRQIWDSEEAGQLLVLYFLRVDLDRILSVYALGVFLTKTGTGEDTVATKIPEERRGK